VRKLIIAGFVLALVGCGGGGDSSTAPSVSVASAPTTTSTCNLLTYDPPPKEYFGKHQIPAPAGTLNTEIVRSVGLKDYYFAQHPTPTGCRIMWDQKRQIDFYYSRLMYTATLDRLQKLGIDRMWIYNYAPFSDFNASTWTVNHEDWQIPESELIWIIQETKKRGIKPYLAWQLFETDMKGNRWNNNHTYQMTQMTEAEFIKIMEGWRNVVTDLAMFGEKYGVAGMGLDWNAQHLSSMRRFKETAIQKFISIHADIRKHFTGKLVFGQQSLIFHDPRILSLVDEISVSLIPRITLEQNNNLTVEMLEEASLKAIENMYYQYTDGLKLDIEIPVGFEIAIQSRDKYFVEGWVEDGFCITSTGMMTGPGNTECIQKTYVPDFSVQALGVEAMMRAISKQKFFKVKSVNFSTAYWGNDKLYSSPSGNYGEMDGFPQLSQSIRAKPAEDVARAWFKR
jgi:hypothetical protein